VQLEAGWSAGAAARIASLCATGLAACVALAICGAAAAQQGFEKPPTLQAAKILPSELLSGPHHRVEERVANDGFMNHYRIESDFGPFTADSTTELWIRVAEIGAIARLVEVSRSEQFAKGVGKAGRGVLASASGAVLHPVDTLEDAASGVKEFVSSAGRTLSGEGDRDVGEAIGYGRAKRQYAVAFGADPYSTNPVLQEHLERVSRAGYLGDVGAGAAVGFASGGAGIALSAAVYLESLHEMVLDKSPEELREINGQKLEAMGVEPRLIRLYLGNEAFSPTYQTAFVSLMEEMDGVADRGEFVRVALRAKNEDEVLFRVDQARMYSHYHKSVRRLRAFVPIGRRVAIAARASDGTAVLLAPADYVALTRSFADQVIDPRVAREKVGGASSGRLWVAGGISAMAKKWLEANGWSVRANLREQLLPR
jgi:hypothetical protein